MKEIPYLLEQGCNQHPVNQVCSFQITIVRLLQFTLHFIFRHYVLFSEGISNLRFDEYSQKQFFIRPWSCQLYDCQEFNPMVDKWQWDTKILSQSISATIFLSKYIISSSMYT